LRHWEGCIGEVCTGSGCIWNCGIVCVPSGGDEECGAGEMSGSGVGAGDGVFHSPSHAFVVIFRVGDVGAVPCVRDIAPAGGEDDVF
jgi:hypothetical protein